MILIEEEQRGNSSAVGIASTTATANIVGTNTTFSLLRK
jgi:hypothetical protein